MSTPILGTIIGIIIGAAIGVLAADYFQIVEPIDWVCLVASTILVFQLLCTTIAATLGKTPPTD